VANIPDAFTRRLARSFRLRTQDLEINYCFRMRLRRNLQRYPFFFPRFARSVIVLFFQLSQAGCLFLCRSLLFFRHMFLHFSFVDGRDFVVTG